MIWHALTEPVEVGPLATLQEIWNKLPDAAQRSETRAACAPMRDYVVRTRKQFEPKFENLHINQVHKGTQSFVLWKNKQYAAHRRRADFGFLDDAVEPADAVQRERLMAACEEFCSLFPDAFYISERGRDYIGTPKDQQEKGRLLSAGFHSMMGYFRDDAPLQELILDETGPA